MVVEIILEYRLAYVRKRYQKDGWRKNLLFDII